MGPVFYGSASKAEAVRRAIQHSQESLRVLAQHYGISQETVANWKNRNAWRPARSGCDLAGYWRGRVFIRHSIRVLMANHPIRDGHARQGARSGSCADPHRKNL